VAQPVNVAEKVVNTVTRSNAGSAVRKGAEKVIKDSIRCS